MLSGQDVLGAGLPGWMVAGRALHSSEATGWSSWFGSAAECILCSGDATGWAPPLFRQGLRLCPCVPWQGGAIGLIPQFATITRSCSAIAPVWVGRAWMVSLHVEVGLQAGLCNQVGIGCAPLLHDVANWALSSGQAFSWPHSWARLGIVLCGHVKLLSTALVKRAPGSVPQLGRITCWDLWQAIRMLSNRMGHLCSMARHDHRLFSLAAQGHCLVYLTLWGQRLCSTGWTGQNLSQIKVNSSCLKSLQIWTWSFTWLRTGDKTLAFPGSLACQTSSCTYTIGSPGSPLDSPCRSCNLSVSIIESILHNFSFCPPFSFSSHLLYPLFPCPFSLPLPFLAAAAAAAAKLLQSCLTLCDPTDSSPPGFPVHGIL